MTGLVLDASVVCKWFLRGPDEPDLELADALAVLVETVPLYAPPHWLAEVVGVMARDHAIPIQRVMAHLSALDLRVEQAPEQYTLAVEIARRTGTHVFDSLYHAVALSARDRTLVTADRKYFALARGMGQIALLSEFGPQLERGVREARQNYKTPMPRLRRPPPHSPRGRA
jgi:predicted nucleic acid-binding protein